MTPSYVHQLQRCFAAANRIASCCAFRARDAAIFRAAKGRRYTQPLHARRELVKDGGMVLTVGGEKDNFQTLDCASTRSVDATLCPAPMRIWFYLFMSLLVLPSTPSENSDRQANDVKNHSSPKNRSFLFWHFRSKNSLNHVKRT